MSHSNKILTHIGVFAALLIFPFSAIAAITYTRSPSGSLITSPFTISVTADSFSDYGLTPGVDRYYLTLDDDYNPHTECFPSTQLSASATFDVPLGDVVRGVMLVGFTGFCETGDEPYYLEGNGEAQTVTFIISPAAGLPSVPSSGGTRAYRPDVLVSAPRGQSFFSSEVPVEYTSIDKNDAMAPDGDHPFGLATLPVSIYFSDQILEWNHTLIPPGDKTLITSYLPAKGSYVWRIGELHDLSPGNFYRILVDAVDKVGEIGEDASDFFSFDPVPPTFIVNADPPVVREGKVTINVSSSEDLKSPPALTVTQRGGRSSVPVSLSGEGSTWEGIYTVSAGHDGTALIAVSGLDRAGNLGKIIISGGSFNVGIDPPPPPAITTPQHNAVVSQNEIAVTGTSREDTEIVLMLNGAPSGGTKVGPDGAFTIEKVPLNKTLPRGENVLTVFARDKAGVESAAVVLRVSMNAKPSVIFEGPAKNSILSGTSTLFSAKVVDENKDPVLLRYEAFPIFLSGANENDAADWLSLGETLSGKLLVDTTELSDGQYLLRAVASDGAITTTSESRAVTVKNQLPLIRFIDGKRTVVPEDSATVRGSVLAPDIIGDRPTITEIAYSRDRGESWIALPAADGVYNSFEERFAATFAFQAPAEGSHDILWRATDSRGFTAIAKHPVIVDTTPPKAPTLIFPGHHSLVSRAMDEDVKKAGLQITMLGKAEPRSVVKIELAGRFYNTEASFADGSFSQKVEFKERGEYTIKAVAVDAAGNKSTQAVALTTYNSPPQVVFISPRDGKGVHGTYGVRWLLKDPDGDPIQNLLLSYGRGKAETVLVKNPKENMFAWDTTKLPTGNDYSLTLLANDGHATSSVTISTAIDNSPPAINALTTPQRSFTGKGVLRASGLASDDLSGVEYVEYVVVTEGEKIPTTGWRKGKLTTGTGGAPGDKVHFTIEAPLQVPDGSYHFLVRAIDVSGNISSSKEEMLVVDATPPRLGSFSLFYGALTIFPANGQYTVPVNTPVSIALSLEEDTKEASLVLNTANKLVMHALDREAASGLWKTDLTLSAAETTDIALTTIDKAGNKGLLEHIATIASVPPGRVVYQEKNATLPAQEKTIAVQVFDPGRNTYTEWNDEFSLSDLPNGAYLLALPRGTYRLTVTSPSFTEFTTEPFTLDEAQFITKELTIHKKLSFWGIMKAWFKQKFNRK